MTAIDLRHITKTYPVAARPAVRDVSLTVKEGTIVTLLGPSGCGKTTILRVIAGLERAESGEVFLAGRAVSGEANWVPPERRGVGMVFQDWALFPHLDVFRNVSFGYKGADRRERVREVLELVNLVGYERRYPHQLSGGQQQRVALARALARRPVVVLLDEPFSSLDADLRVQMRVELKRILKEAGTTAVLVTHDQRDALAISDRIAVLNDGAIQQVGTPREIYRRPANTFVALFVGRGNLLKGVLAADAGSVVTALGAFRCNPGPGGEGGREVQVVIRPGELELSRDGGISGRVRELTYTGDAFDAVIEVEAGGDRCALGVRLHPEEAVRVGDRVSLKVSTSRVAVVPLGT